MTDYFKKGRELATAATTAVIVIAATVITTAAENNNKKNNNPAAIAATKAVTHVFFLLSKTKGRPGADAWSPFYVMEKR